MLNGKTQSMIHKVNLLHHLSRFILWGMCLADCAFVEIIEIMFNQLGNRFHFNKGIQFISKQLFNNKFPFLPISCLTDLNNLKKKVYKQLFWKLHYLNCIGNNFVLESRVVNSLFPGWNQVPLSSIWSTNISFLNV